MLLLRWFVHANVMYSCLSIMCKHMLTLFVLSTNLYFCHIEIKDPSKNAASTNLFK